MIVVEGFSKAYDARLAVEGLGFTVASGEIVGLVGPNGAGKTTTLRSIAGILRPTAGTITVAGHDVVQDPVAAKSALALVPDDPPLFQSLTVWEHLELTAQLYGLTEWEPLGEELLARFDLADRRDTLADELSRGMRQKTAVCAAFLHAPSALMLDEPLTGLDPRAIRSLYGAIRDTAAEGAAVLLSSHLLGQIEGLCTSFVIVREGRLVVAGTRDEIRAGMPELRADASLEEIFFSATEGTRGSHAVAPDGQPTAEPDELGRE
jgi:ABC-2 type transport system ATP-binding protein